MKIAKHLRNRIKNRKLAILVLAMVIFEFVFPHYSLAAEVNLKTNNLIPLADQVGAINLVNNTTTTKSTIKLEPESESLVAAQTESKILKTHKVMVTAYSSTADQTDSTPCQTANGFDLCQHNQEDVVAANFLPFGTKIRMPEYFGDRIFTVQDRMNARYNFRVDVWFMTRQAARQFGIRTLTIEVVE